MNDTNPRNSAFSEDDLRRALTDDRNWGRWGPNDEYGALNLINGDKRRQAAAAVTEGRSLTLSRRLGRAGGFENPSPMQHLVATGAWGSGGGMAEDYVGLSYHGRNVTHIDALCHNWAGDGMWGGRAPDDVIGPGGASFGDIDQWHDGVVTRGVFIDIPALRGVPYVQPGEPVTDDELEAAVNAGGVPIEPGDALVVYSGRDAWEAKTRDTWTSYPPPERPGLHASCLRFLRRHDVAVLVWDDLDATPTGYDSPWTVHGAIYAYGIALVDNALLTDLAAACRQRGRPDFMLVVAPLRIPGGTGSPVNPIAIL